MEFGMSRRINVRISMKKMLCNLNDPLINKELWSYIVKFEIVGRK